MFVLKLKLKLQIFYYIFEETSLIIIVRWKKLSFVTFNFRQNVSDANVFNFIFNKTILRGASV